VTFAKRPSEGRDGRIAATDLPDGLSEIFFSGDWTGGITLIGFTKLGFSRGRFWVANAKLETAAAWSGRVKDRANFEMHAGLLLQRTDDAKQVLGGRVAFGSEHAHQAFLRSPKHFAQPLKANGRIDIGPQRRAAVVGVALQQRLHRLLKQRLAEGGIMLRTLPYRIAEIPGQWHGPHLSLRLRFL
jgi:hypothetical protein